MVLYEQQGNIMKRVYISVYKSICFVMILSSLLIIYKEASAMMELIKDSQTGMEYWVYKKINGYYVYPSFIVDGNPLPIKVLVNKYNQVHADRLKFLKMPLTVNQRKLLDYHDAMSFYHITRNIFLLEQEDNYKMLIAQEKQKQRFIKEILDFFKQEFWCRRELYEYQETSRKLLDLTMALEVIKNISNMLPGSTFQTSK